MSGVAVVARKELRDAVRDRRSVLSALLFPLVGPLLVTVMFSVLARKHGKEADIELAVQGRENGPALVDYLEEEGVKVTLAPAEPDVAVRSGEVAAVLVIPDTFEQDLRRSQPARVELVLDESNTDARASQGRVQALLRAWGLELGALRLLARGVDPGVARPVVVDEVNLATPARVAASLLGMIPMFVLMAAFLGGMYVATDATAGERERGSLEPLLCTPVRRLELVVGKWLAACAFAGTGVVLTLGSTLVALGFAPLEEIGIRLHLGAGQIGGVLLVVLPLAALATALQLLVASLARSFKEAQTYLSLLVFLPMIPGMITTTSQLRTELWMALVPALGQQALLTDLLRGEPQPWWWAVAAAGVTLLGTAACLAGNARLLRRERVIFGR